MKTSPIRRLAMSLAPAASVAFWLLAAPAFGQGTYSWNTTSGSWNTTDANWSGASSTWVNGASSNAVFNNTSGATVTLSGSTSAGTVSFGDSSVNRSWTLSSGTLTAAGNFVYQGRNINSGNYSVNPTLTITSNVNVVGSTLVGRANLTISGGTFTTNRLTANPTSADWANITINGGEVTATNGVDGTYGTTGSNGTVGTFAVNVNGGTLSTTYLKVADREAGSNNNAWLTLNGGVLRALSSTSSFIQTYGGGSNVFLSTNGAIFDTNGFDVGVGATLVNTSSQVGSLTKNGNGTLTLSGTNTYSGSTTISAGRLVAASTSALGASRVTVSGGQLDLGGYTIANAITLTSGTLLGSGAVNGAGAVAVSGGAFSVPTGTLNVGAVTVGGTQSANPSVTNLLTGSGQLAATSLIVQGNAANSHTNNGFRGSTPVSISSGTLTTTGNVGVGRWGLTFGGSSTVIVSGTIGGGGIASSADWASLTISDSAVVTAMGGINGNAEAWQLNLNGGTLYTPRIQASDREGSSSARLVFNGTRIIATTSTTAFVTVGANEAATNTALVGNGGVDIDSSGYNIGIAVNLAPSGGSTGGLTKRGAGTLTLTGTNSYTGGITISGGTLQVGNGDTTGSLADASPVSVASGAALAFNRSGGLTYGGTISGAGGLTKQGAGLLVITGENTFAGTTTISGGTLSVGNGGTSGGLGGNVVNNAAILFNRSNGSTFAGNISGSGSLTKLGSGTLALSGSHSYLGATTVQAGRLALNGWLTGTAGVTVQSGGELGGSGVIAGSIGGDGLIGPGNSPGILTVQGQVVPTSTTAFAFEFSATGSPTWSNATASVNDVLRLTNAAPFASPLGTGNVVNIYFDVSSLTNGDAFLGGFYSDQTADLLDFTAAIGSPTYQFFVKGNGGGTFAYHGGNYYSLAQYLSGFAPGITGVTASVVTVPSADFSGGTISNGQVTQFVIVPEPGALALAGLGVAVAVWAGTRSRRRAS